MNFFGVCETLILVVVEYGLGAIVNRVYLLDLVVLILVVVEYGLGESFNGVETGTYVLILVVVEYGHGECGCLIVCK